MEEDRTLEARDGVVAPFHDEEEAAPGRAARTPSRAFPSRGPYENEDELQG